MTEQGFGVYEISARVSFINDDDTPFLVEPLDKSGTNPCSPNGAYQCGAYLCANVEDLVDILTTMRKIVQAQYEKQKLESEQLTDD